MIALCLLTNTHPLFFVRIGQRYCVRPNAGIVKVGDTKSVEVVLQPNKQPGSTDTKVRMMGGGVIWDELLTVGLAGC